MDERNESGHPFIAACPCGSCRVGLDHLPRERFLCHCTICQRVYNSDFADATIMLARHVEVLTPDRMTYTRHKAPPVLDRGTCSQCGHPVAGFLKVPGIGELAFVPMSVLPREASALPPRRHIHYGTRVRDVADDLPKTDGELASTLVLAPAILRVALRG